MTALVVLSSDVIPGSLHNNNGSDNGRSVSLVTAIAAQGTTERNRHSSPLQKEPKRRLSLLACWSSSMSVNHANKIIRLRTSRARTY